MYKDNKIKKNTSKQTNINKEDVSVEKLLKLGKEKNHMKIIIHSGNQCDKIDEKIK